MRGIIGRSERIRTSDPLLPKQVRYQAALRSDREAGVKPIAWLLQEGPVTQPPKKRPYFGGLFRDSIRLMRGMVPVSCRVRDSSTGLFFETFARLSRSTM